MRYGWLRNKMKAVFLFLFFKSRIVRYSSLQKDDFCRFCFLSFIFLKEKGKIQLIKKRTDTKCSYKFYISFYFVYFGDGAIDENDEW